MGDEQFEPTGDWQVAFRRRQAEDAFIRKAARWAGGFLVGVVVFVILVVL